MKHEILNGHFGYRYAITPKRLVLGQLFGSIIDGITGLIMLPFSRYGTTLSLYFSEESIRWGANYRKAQREKDKNLKLLSPPGCVIVEPGWKDAPLDTKKP